MNNWTNRRIKKNWKEIVLSSRSNLSKAASESNELQISVYTANK